MANDDFDNRRVDDELAAKLAKIYEPSTKHPTASIDIRTTPDRCEIYVNKPALDDLIGKLQRVAALCLPTTAVCIAFTNQDGKTMLEISTDDGGGRPS